jgi:adenylate cyclase
MRLPLYLRSHFSVMTKYRYKWVLMIALAWTLIDVASWIHFMNKPYEERSETVYQFMTPGAVILRAAIDFVMSILMGNLLVFRLKKLFKNYPLFLSLLLKTGILIVASFLMNFLVHFSYSVFTLHLSFVQAFLNFKGEVMHRAWLFDKMTTWFIIFLITQLIIEINEKYSPGVFLDILVGRYINPREEKRIIMFLDLKDSTPIAEQLGSNSYFRFIRDFIAAISMALLENNGRIYQYVGDEIVVSWKYTDENAMTCIQAVIAARRAIQKRSEDFRREYGIIPEFKVGIHVGVVTVGEIGIIKKDLAMSGDTMNTTARIRTACTELNQKFVTSKDFIEHLNLKDWQAESLGYIDLKGKSDGIELFALKI